MSTAKNKVQLIGNIGNAPEIRTLESGRKMARFSVATNDSYRTAGGEWVSQTQWHNIIAWGKMAERAEELLDRGSAVAIEGKLMNNSYTGKDGVKKYYTQVQATAIELPQEVEEQETEDEAVAS